jgi:hypothetical protein
MDHTEEAKVKDQVTITINFRLSPSA